jgi:hypothetical protein
MLDVLPVEQSNNLELLRPLPPRPDPP